MSVSVLDNSAQRVATARFSAHYSAMNKSLQRLASGERITQPGDDPTGVAAAPKMHAGIKNLEAKIKALDEQDAYFGATEGAQSVLSDQLIQLKSLVVSAANRSGLSDDERKGLQTQADNILSGIEFLSNTARYQDQQVLQGYNTKSLGILDLRSGGAQNLFDGDLETADKSVQAALDTISQSRATLGTSIKSNQAVRRTLNDQMLALTDDVSKIEDTDYAAETATFMREQMLTQVNAYVQKLAQDTHRDTVLELLQGIKPR